jgi:hypothetical protein
MITLFCLLLVGHALADYPFQGDFLARAKNHAAPIPGVPWIHGLLWHAVIHGGAVGLIMSSTLLGTLEVLMHAGIDYAKCAGWFERMGTPISAYTAARGEMAQRCAFHIDQALHVACKVLWVLLYAGGVQ